MLPSRLCREHVNKIDEEQGDMKSSTYKKLVDHTKRVYDATICIEAQKRQLEKENQQLMQTNHDLARALAYGHRQFDVFKEESQKRYDELEQKYNELVERMLH